MAGENIKICIAKPFLLWNIIITCSFLISCDQKEISDRFIDQNKHKEPIPLKLIEKYNLDPISGDSLFPLLNQKGQVIPTGKTIPLLPENWDTLEIMIENKKAGPPSIHLPLDPITKVNAEVREFRVEREVIESTILNFDTLEMRMEKLNVQHPSPVNSPPFSRKDPNPANILTIGIDHGIKSLLLWDCLHDNQGNIWTVSEGGGLSRFDGEQMQTYTKKDGLTTEVLLALFQDSKGNIWFGGWGGNVMKYDGYHFYEISMSKEDYYPQVNDFQEDADGRIWVSTAEDGIFILEDTMILHLKELSHMGKAEGIYPGLRDGMWIGSEKGSVFYRGDYLDAYLFPEKMHDYGISPALVDQNKGVWFIIWGYGLVKIDRLKAFEFTVDGGLINSRVMEIVEDHESNIWIGTQSGLQKWNDHHFENYTTISGLPINDVYGLCVDNQNNLWMAFSGGGLGLLRQNGLSNLSQHDVLPHDQLSFITELRNGDKVIGSWGNGLLVMQEDANLVYREEQGLRINYFLNMAGVRDKVFFQDFYGMGSFDGKFFKYYNISEGPYTTYNYCFTDRGELWLGTKQYGIIKKEKSSFRPLYLPYLDIEGTYPIHEDDIGELWVGVNTLLVNIKNNQATYYSALEGFFNTHSIQRITQDRTGNLWIATKLAGLFRFDGTSFQEIIGPDLSQDGDIYLEADSENRIWLMAPFRLTMITPDKTNYKITHFSKKNGLYNYELSSMLKSDDGKLYIAGRDGGLDIFELEKFRVNQLPPKIFIQNIEVNGEYQDFTGRGLKTAHNLSFSDITPYQNLPTELALNHQSNHLTFSFSGIDWSNQEDVRYSYLLYPFEKNWSPPTSESRIDYRNIPYGNFSFKVRARSQNQEWSDPAIFNFRIHPPWWKTTTAYFCYFILMGLGVYIITQIRTRNLRDRQKQMEAEIAAATLEISKQKEKAELSEKYKEQFLANMSHEIRTPLNSILGMIKILKRKSHPRHQEVFLEAMAHSSNNLSKLLNDILDLSKIEAGKIEIEHKAMSVSNVLDHVIFTLGIKAKEKGLKLTSEIDERVPLYIQGDQQRLSQILINLVGNAIKFSEKGTIHIKVRKKQQTLIYVVEDQGIGMSDEELSTIFDSFSQAKNQTHSNKHGTGLGLSITKQLIELQNGNIWVESKKGEGSMFAFELPLVEIGASISEIGPAEPELKAMGKTLQGLKILLAEDDAFNQMIAREEAEWYIPELDLTIAENGREAYEKWKMNQYDLILTDVEMPELSGFELTQRIREEEKNIKAPFTPIIAMTASVLSSDIKKCREAGMDAYIPKPFQSHEFIGTIYKTLKNKDKFQF